MAVTPFSSDQRGTIVGSVADGDPAPLYREVFDVISCNDVLDDIIRRDQNFLGLWTKGSEIAALEHRWFYVNQMPQVLDVNASNLTNNNATTTFDIPVAQAARIVADATAGIYSYLINPAYPTETLKVADIDLGEDKDNGADVTLAQVTVTREVTGTAVAHDATTQFQIMDTPYPEGSAPVIQRHNEPSWFRNTCEMFERYLELTRHEVRAKVKYTDDYFGWLVAQNSIDVLDELAYAFLHGQWSGTAGAWSLGTKTVARRTRGLLSQLKATTDADGITIVPNVSSTATVFDLDAIETLSAMVDDAKGKLGGGSGEGVLMMPVDLYDAAMDIWDDRMISIDRTETTVGRKVKAIETKRDHVLRIMKDHRWPKGHLAILNPPDMKYMPFVGSDWVAEQYAKTRDSENWRLYGDYFTEVKHAQSNFALLTNVSAS